MLDTINKMASLQEEIQNLHDQLDEKMQPIIKRYSAAHYDGCTYGNPSDAANYSWEVTTSEISVTWDEHWSYGGHDEGGFEMPLNIVEEDILAAYEQKRIQEKRLAAINKHDKEKADKKYQLEQLKKELGEV